MKDIVLWVWQLPQHILGMILIKLFKAERQQFHIGNKGGWFWSYEPKKPLLSGVSLGRFIILPKNMVAEETVLHEYGHSKQSAILGWLYLPIIGIYSAVFCNIWDRLFHKRWSGQSRYEWYYSRWCEAWADKLGGVKRGVK